MICFWSLFGSVQGRHRPSLSSPPTHPCPPLLRPVPTKPQSADVSRLKSRWIHQPPPPQASFPQTSRRTAGPNSTPVAVEGVGAASPTSQEDASTGPGTTPDGGSSSFPAGTLLELDVTPPFTAASRRQQYGGGRGCGGGNRAPRATAEAGAAAGGPARDTAPQLYREQEPAAPAQPTPRTAGLHAEPAASSSSSSSSSSSLSPRPAQSLGRRQLVFGGMDCAADRQASAGDGRLVGGEGVGDRAEAVPREIRHHPHGAVAAAVGAGVVVPRADGQSGMLDQEWVRASNRVYLGGLKRPACQPRGKCTSCLIQRNFFWLSGDDRQGPEDGRNPASCVRLCVCEERLLYVAVHMADWLPSSTSGAGDDGQYSPGHRRQRSNCRD